MGWNFQRSLNIGPLRLNASKSGIGYSVGARGFRVGKDAKGRNYTTTSIPGTGIYRRDYQQSGGQPTSPNAARRPNSIKTATRSHAAGWLLYLTIAILFDLMIRILK